MKQGLTLIIGYEVLFRLVTAGIEPPPPPRSWCEHYTDVTTEKSKRSIEYRVISKAHLPQPMLGGHIGIMVSIRGT